MPWAQFSGGANRHHTAIQSNPGHEQIVPESSGSETFSHERGKTAETPIELVKSYVLRKRTACKIGNLWKEDFNGMFSASLRIKKCLDSWCFASVELYFAINRVGSENILDFKIISCHWLCRLVHSSFSIAGTTDLFRSRPSKLDMS